MAADAQIPFLRQHLKRSKKAFTLRQLLRFYKHRQRYLLGNRRRIKDAQETSCNHFIDLCRRGRKTPQRRKALSGRDNRIVIRDLFVVDITGFCNFLITIFFQNLHCVCADRSEIAKSAEYFYGFPLQLRCKTRASVLG